DIGPETVELYAEELQSKEIRIKGGPLGVYEKGYNNGSELVKRIAGYGLIFLGGDTASELVKNDLYSVIESVGGKVCLSGGAFLHGLVGKRYPSIDEILKLKK
ncbi:MAG: phosphoglycerate kinase, partial [Candidatus Aenigmarchaeota archaeon]|nr:phosphoglycerate kinase [Candidatus Aenigmarchaeota archaeon]